MKRTFLALPLLCLFLATQSCQERQTDLVLLGTVHQPVENFTPDTLYNILVELKPDLILFEVDSSFTEDFTFNKTWESNENIATVRYMENFDVDVRPYEFTGRNEYRIRTGARPTDSKALNLLDGLYNKNVLNPSDGKIYKDYLNVNDSLNSLAYMGAKAFNNPKTDRIAQNRQKFQYSKLLNIMSEYPIFSNTYYVKHEGDSVSYLEGYKRASEFWDLRNRTMAKNILHFTDEYKGKRIVVLNGFFHRYYLDSLLRSEQENGNFVIKNFDEY